MSEPAVVIRRARRDEHDAIRALTDLAYAQYATIMTPSAWTGLRSAIQVALSADRGAEYIVAEREGVLIGSVMLFPPSAHAYGDNRPRVRWPEIRALAVTPSARGSGVARLLVDECIGHAREMGAESIGLHTSRSMREAIRLYEQFGFVRDPQLDIHVDGSETIEAYRRML